MARFQILPPETKFFDWFERSSTNVKKAAHLFNDLVSNYERPALKVAPLTEAERQGDFIMHEITTLLRNTLITPLDPEETQALAHSLDDVVDSMEQAANKMVLYQVEEMRDEAHEFSRIILRAADSVDAAMPLLRDNKAMMQLQKHAQDINGLEREADALYRRALERLIATSRNDWFEFTRWKDIFDEMERVCDRFEAVADVLQTVVLKNA